MEPEVVRALVKAIELKDAGTAAHTWRVVLYTRAMAEEEGVDRGLIERLTFAAALHDIGKLEIPDSILLKPGPLTAEEFAVIRTHAALGHERLVRMGETDPVVLGLVRHHHERWDGTGYPDGLAGRDIPAGARHFAVIDTFDALTSLRPYRSEVGEGAGERAMATLEEGKGTAFQPESVEMFARLVRGGRVGWIMEHFNDRCAVAGFDPAGVRSPAPR